MRVFRIVSLLAASLTFVTAQTHSKCDPKTTDNCPKNPALSGKYSHSFSQSGLSTRFRKTQQGEVSYKEDGCHLRINRAKESGPQIESNFYIMYGKVDVRMKSAPGKGIVSSIALISDSLDEIDWEFTNNKPNTAWSNYFGRGGEGANEKFNRGGEHSVANHGDWHTYTLIWTPSSLKWIIDGQVVRELTPAMASGWNHYPQTPMEIKIGSWAGGDSSQNPKGTIEWSGGETDFSQAPFDMVIESVSIEDYSTGKFYTYADRTGKLESIRSEGGKIFGAPNNDPPTLPSSSTKTTSTKTTSTKTTSTKTTSTKEPSTKTTSTSSSASTKSTPAPTPTDKPEDKSSSTDSSSSIEITSRSSSSTSGSAPTSTKSGFETSTTNPSETQKPTGSPSPSGAVLSTDSGSLAVSVRAFGLSWALVFGIMGWLL